MECMLFDPPPVQLVEKMFSEKFFPVSSSVSAEVPLRQNYPTPQEHHRRWQSQSVSWSSPLDPPC